MYVSLSSVNHPGKLVEAVVKMLGVYSRLVRSTGHNLLLANGVGDRAVLWLSP